MKTIALLLIRGYQLTLAPLLGRHCRYLPTCSQYAYEAVQRHGAWRGSWLALRRLLRCHPLHAGGLDPVPELSEVKSSWKRNA
jgi:putative membrane protein insertion efficiency factor